VPVPSYLKNPKARHRELGSHFLPTRKEKNVKSEEHCGEGTF
jgi:hypothetical protein